jgi:hypothetical protein
MTPQKLRKSSFAIIRPVTFAGILVMLPLAGLPSWAKPPVQGAAEADHQEQKTSHPTPRTPDGKPDFSGVWNGPSEYLSTETADGQLPFTAAGKAAYQFNLNKATDPQALCILVGEPRADLDGEPFEIFQTPKRIGFLYEKNDSWRQVAVDRTQHPKDPEPSFFGDSVGTWEGDTLVVDVTGIKGLKIWGDNVGHPQSDSLHLVERWTRPDVDHLQVEMTLTDPKYYTKPLKITRKMVRQKYDLIENSCDEKHVREHPGFGVESKE